MQWLLLPLLLTLAAARRPKLVLLDSKSCSRYSLDALYHEEYWPQTLEALDGLSDLVEEVADRMLDDFQSLFVQIHEMSTKGDKGHFQRFTDLKKRFTKKVDKMKHNLTVSWDNFLSVNRDFLTSKDNITPGMVIKRAGEVDEAYKRARLELDRQMADFVAPLKGMVLNGINGLEAAVDMAIQQDIKANKSAPPREHKIQEIIDDILPKFLSNVTKKLLQRRKPEVGTKKSVDDRDSVLDDIFYTTTLMKGKVKVLLSADNMRSEEKVDLARRNLYMMWNSSADKMYRRKKSKKAKNKRNRLWSKEEDLTEILGNLLESYT